MPYKIFSIPIPPGGGEDEELNRFLATHRVAAVRTQWVSRTSGDETIPYQVFTVEFVAGKEPQGGLATPPSSEATARVDYREKLTPEQFALYCRLRDLRKVIAEEESVKPFVVFTNAQLAAFAQTKPATLAALRETEGVGEARAEKYGARMLAAIADDGKREPSTADDGEREADA